jgi:pantothenate kinase type III
LISHNAEHERGLKFLFSQVPCHLFKLRASDFWNLESYPNIGVDRVADLRGSQSCFGLPALVIDDGMAMTCTAADASGKLMGGKCFLKK